MGWYFASSNDDKKPCKICGEKVVGKDISQEEFTSSSHKEKRDMIYLTEDGVEHAACVWKEADK
jgi:hypothetical protein